MRVWAQLAELFGKGFYREHGMEPTNLWLTTLSKIGDDQIAIGLANLGNDGLQFPPNLSQFLAACKRPKIIPPYWDKKALIEDKSESGHMPFAEWKARNA